MDTEMDEHLGYGEHQPTGSASWTPCNRRRPAHTRRVRRPCRRGVPRGYLQRPRDAHRGPARTGLPGVIRTGGRVVAVLVDAGGSKAGRAAPNNHEAVGLALLDGALLPRPQGRQ